MKIDLIIEKLKKGGKEERCEARSELNKLWRKSDYRNKGISNKFLAEMKRFDDIPKVENKAAIVGCMKWALYDISKMHFDIAKEFIIENLQHSSGKVRQAAVHAADYVIMSLRLHSIDSENNTKKDKEEEVVRDRDRLCLFMSELEDLSIKHYKKEYKPFKYLEDIPPGPYKSIGFVLSRLSHIYDYIYGKDENEIEMAEDNVDDVKNNNDLHDCSWRRTQCDNKECMARGEVQGELENSKEFFEYITKGLTDALEIVKQYAKDTGVKNTSGNKGDKTPQLPLPKEFPLWRSVEEWHRIVHKIAERAARSGELWVYTESAADIFWYSNIVSHKVYQQLCNKWSKKVGIKTKDGDYKKTKKILNECIEIINKSLNDLSMLRTKEKGEIMVHFARFKKIEQEILTL